MNPRHARPTHGRILSAVAALLLALTALPSAAEAQVQWSAVAEGYPTTAAEDVGFDRHTNHEEMWAYLRALKAVTPHMYLGSYGQTWLGRDLAYAVFSRPLISQPWEANTLDRPVLLLAANVHGDERTFREGLLVLMRDFATPGTEAYELLDEVTVLVAPQINPDGFEAEPGGTRENSRFIDLNRDYVKLEHPAIASYVGNLVNEWRPHLYIDGHNGGSRPYNLNYQCPSHADPAPEITLLCDDEIFPAIDAKLDGEGYRSWYYTGGNEEAWRVGGSQARIGRNYGGFVNSVAILFEAPNQTLDVGARAGYLGYLAVVEWAAENAELLTSVIAEANAETIAMGAEPRGEITTEMEYEAEEYTVDYLLVEDGGRGTDPEEAVDAVLIEGAQLMKKPVVLASRPRPWAYVLPPYATDAVAMLQRHGIAVEQLTEETELTVDAYTVAGVSHERAYDHAAATVVDVGELVTLQETFPPHSYVVRTAQQLGRLVGHMLEPETEDNVVYWNTLDAYLPRSADDVQGDGPPLVPIYKLMRPMALPTELLRD